MNGILKCGSNEVRLIHRPVYSLTEPLIIIIICRIYFINTSKIRLDNQLLIRSLDLISHNFPVFMNFGINI